MTITKILPYNPYGEDESQKYPYVCDLLSQKIDPPSLEPGSLNCYGKRVFVSPLRRSIECVDKASAESFEMSELLQEIPFSLGKFCGEAEFVQQGSTAVRNAFVQAFISDGLNISHQRLKKELELLFELGKDNEDALFVSHTFRMKLIEIYSKVGDGLFSNPKIISKYLDVDKHLYNFGDTINV